MYTRTLIEARKGFIVLSPFTNLFEFISRLSNHTGQNQHIFQSRLFSFLRRHLVWQNTVVWTRSRQEQSAPIQLSLLSRTGGAHSPTLFLLLWEHVSLTCVSSDDFHLPYFQCFLSPLIFFNQDNWPILEARLYIHNKTVYQLLADSIQNHCIILVWHAMLNLGLLSRLFNRIAVIVTEYRRERILIKIVL